MKQQGGGVEKSGGRIIPPIVPVKDENPESLVGDGELLVCLGAAGAPRAPWVKALIDGSVKAMRQSHHYATLHFGFFKGHGAPYVVVDWATAGAHALERRWVLARLGAAIASGFSSVRKLAFFLETGAGPEQVVMAEDVLTRNMSARYDRNKLQSFKIFSPDADRLRGLDPHFEERLGKQLQFRGWVNENPDELTSIEIGQRLQAFCKERNCSFEALDVDRLKALGMNLLLAVGQASDRSPSRLFLATHNVKPGGPRPLLLVGKGITFDTGGINLKPHESFVNCMKNDMGGAGLMASLFMALVASGYQGPLALAIPACENLIDARAMKPGAIIKSYAGKDVIIEHTDAEGRLVLADALSYAQKQWNPALTIVAATLTTASLRQFTNFFTPVHFAREGFQAALTAAGKAFGEEFTYWGEFLPFANGNRSAAADLTNMGRMPSHASMGGACNVAAHFLREFAVAPMVHIDIFATTWNWSGDYPGAHYGATGAPFNALFQAVRAAGPEMFGYASATTMT